MVKMKRHKLISFLLVLSHALLLHAGHMLCYQCLGDISMCGKKHLTDTHQKECPPDWVCGVTLDNLATPPVYRRECVRLLKQDFLDTCEDTGIRRSRTDFSFSACICQVTDLCNGEDFELGPGRGLGPGEQEMTAPSKGGRTRSEPTMIAAVVFADVIGMFRVGKRVM